MALDVETIGLAMDTSGVERGIKSLDELAARGPKVEQSMQGVERAAKQAGQGVSTLGSTNAQGLEKVGTASQQAAQGLGKMGQAAQSAVSSQAALSRAVDGFTQTERKYIQSLLDEYSALDQTRAAKAAYIAQQKGMSQAAQEVARAVGSKIDALKAERAELEKNERAMQSAQTAAAGFARSLVAAVAGGVAFREFVQAADAVTTLNNQLKLATGSADAAKQAYGSLYEIAQRSRVSFTELGTTYASIARATGEMGISQQRLLKVTESIGNAMTISGGSAQSMQAALVQLGQGFASGTLRGEELNSVMEQTPRLAKAIADGMGISIGKLREMGQAGQLTSEAVVKALESQSEALKKEVAGATLTVGQAFTQMSNASTKAIGDFDQASGASASLAQAISSIATSMDGMGDAFKRNEGTIQTVMGALTGAAALATLAAIPRAIAAIGGAVTGLSAVLAANPVVLGLLGVGAVAGGAVAGLQAYSKTASGIEGAIERLKAENERSEAALQRALDGGRTAGADNIRKTIEERRKAISDLNNELLKLQATEVKGAGGGRGSYNPPTVGERNAQRSAFQSEMDKYLSDNSRQTRAQMREEEIGKARKRNAELIAKAEGDTNAVLQLQAALKTEISNIENKYKDKAAPRASAEANAYKSLTESLREKIAAEQAELSGGAKLSENQKLRIKYAEDLQGSLKGITAAQRSVIEGYLDEHKAAEQANVAAREAMKAAQETAAARNREAAGIDAWVRAQEDAARQSLKSVHDRIHSMEDEARAIELSQGLNVSLAEAIELVAIARLEEKQAGFYDGSEGWLAIQREIDARRELLGLIGSKESREANKRAADEAAKDWERTAQTISDTLADYIMSGGKDAAQYLERLFATLVLQPTVQMLVGGILGTGPAAAASGSSNILGTASNLGSLGAFGGTVSAGLSYGSTSLFANGLGTTLAAGGQMIGAGSIVSGISTIAGAMGPIALGVAALTSLISSLDDSGTPHAGAGAVYSGGKVTGGRDVYSYDRFDLADMNTYSDQVQGLVSPVAQSIGAALDAFATAFGQQAGYTVSTAFADDSSKDASWGALRIEDALGQVLVDWNSDRQSKWAPREFADGEEGQKEYLAAIARDTRDALKTAIGDADWAKDMLDTLGDSVTLEGLGSVVAQINQAKAAFTSFGQYMPTFAGLAQSAVSAMVDAAGGVDPLAQGMATFVENFYSDAEKLAINTENVRKALQELGFEMPETRDEFKALVQAQLALGDAGAKTAAGLLGLSGAFAAVTPAAESAQASIASVSDQLRDAFGMTADAVSGILSDAVKNAETASEAQRMAAQAFEDKFYGGALDGLTDSLGAMIQSSVIAPMMESLIAGSAASASMLASGGAVAAGAMASGGAAGGAASAAGGSYAADAMSSGGASAANAMVSGGSAAGAIVASAVEQARAQVNAYTQILSDPDVQAGIKDISKLMGEVAGMTFAAKSSWGGGGYSAASFNASGAGSEADKLAESLKKLGETVSEEIKRLAGLVNESDPQKNRAALLAEFAIQTAKAKTGDQEAMGELTSLSKAIEQATKLTAASAFDLSATRGWLASSLEDTLKALNLELPKFDVGTNYVPRTMAAIVHEGEAIVPKAYNPWAGGAGGGQDQTALASEIRALREENRQQAGEIARLNLRMTRVLERWDGGGMPPERKETA